MAVFTDTLGNEYTASSEDSVTGFGHVVETYLASSKAVMPQLDALIENDADMIMAHCLRAYMLKLAADPRFDGPFRAITQMVNSRAGAANERERRHVAAIEAWALGDLDEAVRRLESILSDYPRDMVALRVAHYLHFYAGTPEEMRDSVARSVEAWDQSLPYYGYLLGMHAFGLEESGEYGEAEATGQRAIEINPKDVWAAHAVLHVYQMTGQFAEGVGWVDRLMPGFSSVNNFVYHMHWHQALCHIGLGDYDAVLGIYDRHLTIALEDDFYLDVCNAASLLWRLEMLGVNVGDRWMRVNEISQPRLADRELLFSTLHYLMTPARMHDRNAVERALNSLEQWSLEGSTQGEICRSVGLPLARAIVDLSEGNAEEAATTLAALAPDVQKIGGSHAQRDLFNQFHSYAQQAIA